MAKKPKFKGFERGNGKLLKTAYFDGYAFGDRLLEGAIFRADVQKNGTLKVSIAPGSAAYFAGLNQKKWLTSALEWAEQGDIFQSQEDDGKNCEDLVLLPLE